jgi:hypothetical protein|tara:strand:- start:20 stop:559 length:540 start_codon:yes stop_codon:yes gene_type:complete
MKNIIIALLASGLLVGCGMTEITPGVYNQPLDTPSWVDEPPAEEDGIRYFVGASAQFTSEGQARQHARVNAYQQLSEFVGFKLDSKFTELTGEQTGFGTQFGAGKYLQKKVMVTKVAVGKSFIKEYYMNRLLVNERPIFVGYVLIGVSRADIALAIDKSGILKPNPEKLESLLNDAKNS